MIQLDRHTVIQVLGGLMNRPELLNDTDKYRLEVSDFATTLDKFIFSAIYNLYNGGAEKIRAVDIVNYLKDNQTAAVYLEKENGEVFLQDCETEAEPQNFYYYYNRLKKINFLKDIQASGHSIEQFYCEDIFNPHYSEINERFEKLTTKDILDQLKGEVNNYENKFVLNSVAEESKASDDIDQLIKDLKEKPEVGCQLQGHIFNTICRGGRKGKLYLRSASSGTGKTRTMVGDAANLAYPIRFDTTKGRWICTGSAEKVLYVMTEQDPEEIKTMILAYLTGYNEEIFLYGTYGEEEMPRIEIAIEIMRKYEDNLLFARIPDPSASVVKNLFRRYHIQYGVENFFYDYIFSSPAMLNEYRDLGLQEYVCLRLFTTALKNLAIELDSFVLTSTQVSNDDGNGGFKDYHNIQSSKSIANLVDFGCIMSKPTQEEINELSEFTKNFSETPNMVTDVYKNRRGRWTDVRIWSKVDLGRCLRKDLFMTDLGKHLMDQFAAVNFENTDYSKYQDLLDYYNDGIVSDEIYEELTQISDLQPEDLLDNAGEAFELDKDITDKSFGKLIGF